MKKRLGIFSFYDKEGIVDKYVYFLLNDLATVVKRVIIVVNGKLTSDGLCLFQKFSDEIIIRYNRGYDAGAYAAALKYLGNEEILKYEELVFCNDTFFGPFNSFESIFNSMETKICDFWGLNGFFGVVFQHMQSYFLVFRSSILKENLLIEYFSKNINDNTIRLNDVYCQFEMGLFDFLFRQCEKKYAMYALPCDYDVYRYSYACTKYNNLPIIKKKSFSQIEKDEKNILCTLSYVKYETSYDLNLILDCIQRIYGLYIDIEKIKPVKFLELPLLIEVPEPISTEKEIEDFCNSRKFYIYGTGMYASKAYWRFAKNNKNFIGFIVSDNRRGDVLELYEMPIFEYSEISNIQQKNILLGVGPELTEEIYSMFINKERIKRIF